MSLPYRPEVLYDNSIRGGHDIMWSLGQIADITGCKALGRVLLLVW